MHLYDLFPYLLLLFLVIKLDPYLIPPLIYLIYDPAFMHHYCDHKLIKALLLNNNSKAILALINLLHSIVFVTYLKIIQIIIK